MDLVRLCHRNRDGSYGTQTTAGAACPQWQTTSWTRYKLPAAGSLKPKHVEALVERWLDTIPRMPVSATASPGCAVGGEGQQGQRRQP